MKDGSVRNRPRSLGLALPALAVLAAPALAGGLYVAPMAVDLQTGATVRTIHLRNPGTAPVLVQTEVYAWDQDAPEPLTPSRDLVASPPIFTIEPGAEQLVRVGLLVDRHPSKELTYRVVLQEVLEEQGPERQLSGVQFALRIALPVFVAPSGEPDTSLEWAVRAAPEGHIAVTLRNQGTVHVVVHALQIRLPGSGDRIAGLERGRYVLAGGEHTWQLTPDLPAERWSGAQVELSARTGRGPLHQTLTVSVPPGDDVPDDRDGS